MFRQGNRLLGRNINSGFVVCGFVVAEIRSRSAASAWPRSGPGRRLRARCGYLPFRAWHHRGVGAGAWHPPVFSWVPGSSGPGAWHLLAPTWGAKARLFASSLFCEFPRSLSWVSFFRVVSFARFFASLPWEVFVQLCHWCVHDVGSRFTTTSCFAHFNGAFAFTGSASAAPVAVRVAGSMSAVLASCRACVAAAGALVVIRMRFCSCSLIWRVHTRTKTRTKTRTRTRTRTRTKTNERTNEQPKQPKQPKQQQNNNNTKQNKTTGSIRCVSFFCVSTSGRTHEGSSMSALETGSARRRRERRLRSWWRHTAQASRLHSALYTTMATRRRRKCWSTRAKRWRRRP